jgi:hypothetical protein
MNPDQLPWTSYKEASHLIVGCMPKNMGGGILLTARDELTAHRYAACYRKHGYTEVRVLPNNEEGLAQGQSIAMRLILNMGTP